MTKIAFVLGTRPEIIKLYSSIRYCEQNGIDYYVVNTDQHYDKNMRDVFFEELGLKTPKYGLGIGSGSHTKMVASMMLAIEGVFEKERPTAVVVQGDTNTVLAGALVATKMRVKLGHVEAGLRSYDREMPEEYNRIITDHCSDYLFAPTNKQKDILINEGISEDQIYVTGNTVVDAVKSIAEKIDKSPLNEPFVLLTCHRPSNTDNDECLHGILGAVQVICEEKNMKAVFPVHPRLNNKRADFAKYDKIILTEPLGYQNLLQHMLFAEMIFTDSGGIQEESCILERKCIILRTNTERPETVEVGGAVLLNEITKEDILDKYSGLSDKKVEWSNPFGDGKAGQRIINILKDA